MSRQTQALALDYLLERTPPKDPYRALWAAVFLLAVRDAIGANKRGASYAANHVVARARAWIDNTAEDVGSFHWLCIFLDRDPERTRRAIQQQIEAPQATALTFAGRSGRKPRNVRPRVLERAVL